MFRGIKWSCYQVTSVNQIQRKLEWATAQNIAVPPPPPILNAFFLRVEDMTRLTDIKSTLPRYVFRRESIK